MEISPKASALTLAVRRGQFETANQTGDVRMLHKLLFPCFITKIDLGYDRAHAW